jgi:hypothetical protein
MEWKRSEVLALFMTVRRVGAASHGSGDNGKEMNSELLYGWYFITNR